MKIFAGLLLFLFCLFSTTLIEIYLLGFIATIVFAFLISFLYGGSLEFLEEDIILFIESALLSWFGLLAWIVALITDIKKMKPNE